MKIANFNISDKNPPFVIAEMSCNHGGKLSIAKEIIKQAALAGASAIKLQTFQPKEMTLDVDNKSFRINDSNSLWYKRKLFDLYKEAHTPWEWHEELFKFANENNIICFSTPSDTKAVDFLEDLNCPCYKVASFENNNPYLLKKIALTKKPIIVSTGLTSLENISKTVNILRENGNKNYALLVCVSSYPAKTESYNLHRISTLKKIFGCSVGISDHTLNNVASITATSLGAQIIEKHFIHDKKYITLDSEFSADPQDLKLLIDQVKSAKASLGNGRFDIDREEQKSSKYKRSIFCSKDIALGEKITVENISIIRPGNGLSPFEYSNILGLRAIKKIKKGTPLSWDLIK